MIITTIIYSAKCLMIDKSVTYKKTTLGKKEVIFWHILNSAYLAENWESKSDGSYSVLVCVAGSQSFLFFGGITGMVVYVGHCKLL